MRVFAQNWLELVQAWTHRREVENSRIAGSISTEVLRQLLEARARLLMKRADNDSLW